jgi:hypothetical protein
MQNRKVLWISLGVLAVILGIVLVSTRSDGKDSAVSTPTTVASTPVTTAPPGPATTAAPGGTDAATDTAPFTTPDMPVTVDVSPTDRLGSGSVVKIHGVPQSGSSLFGIEARLCRGDVAITNDIEFRPTMGGDCLVAPLSAGTDAHVTEAAAPPYLSVNLSFKVGTGTATFLTQSNKNATITCDRDHPCQLVLKLQYPNGFGFESIPVSFN